MNLAWIAAGLLLAGAVVGAVVLLEAPPEAGPSAPQSPGEHGTMNESSRCAHMPEHCTEARG